MSGEEFEAVVAGHRSRYPLMQPQDYGKLAYQSAFGAEHFVEDEGLALERILSEWSEIPSDAAEDNPQPIGNGLCRFHLTPEYNPETAAPILARLFYLTAREPAGSEKDLQTMLQVLEGMDIHGMADWLSEYRASGCPPIHHSETFRVAYSPRYRLLRTQYAAYFPALTAIASLIGEKKPVLVSVDGRCGSGKTSFGELAAEVFDCNVIHMDDFYLPKEQRERDWQNVPGGNMNFGYLLDSVIKPIQAGQPVSYRPYHCGTGSFGEMVTLHPKSLTVIEGSYSQHPLLREQADFRIFLTCSPERQMSRLREREGETELAAFRDLWIPLEKRYYRDFAVMENAHTVIDTSEFF